MTIADLLSARADAMAAHDGVPRGVVHLHGAANQLQHELLAARDHAIAAHGRAAAPPSPPALAPAPEPVAEATGAPVDPPSEIGDADADETSA